MTGDANVPAGQPTFKVVLHSHRLGGRGEIHLADTGYRNPRWGVARLDIQSNEEFIVLWHTKERGTNRKYYFPLQFTRRKDPLTEDEKREVEIQLHRTLLLLKQQQQEQNSGL